MSATVDELKLRSEKSFQDSFFIYPICALFFGVYILGLAVYFVKIWCCKKLGMLQNPNTIEKPGFLMQTFVFLWNTAITARAKAWLSSQATVLDEMPFKRAK